MVRIKKYEISIIALICINITGLYGGALTLPRVVSLIFVGYIYQNREEIILTSSIKIFFLVWIIISFFSLLWTPDFINGLKFIIYNISNVLNFFLLVLLYKKSNYNITPLLKGWIIFFLLTVPIAIYEFKTGNHLSVSLTSEEHIATETGEKIMRTNASVTFGNLNSYVIVCIYCLPFILAGILYRKKILWLSIVALLGEIIVVSVNASRGGLLCLAICLSIFLHYILKEGTFSKGKIIVCLLLLGALLVYYADFLFSQIMSRLLYSSLTQDSIRSDVYSNCVSVLVNSMFLGAGVGGLEAALIGVSKNDIPAPHNMWLELLCQYGLFTFMFFIYALVKIIGNLKKGNKLNRFLRVELIGLIIPLFIIDSGYIMDTRFWLFLSTFYCISLRNIKKIVVRSDRIIPKLQIEQK